jgi:hypothetical protein
VIRSNQPCWVILGENTDTEGLLKMTKYVEQIACMTR